MPCTESENRKLAAAASKIGHIKRATPRPGQHRIEKLFRFRCEWHSIAMDRSACMRSTPSNCIRLNFTRKYWKAMHIWSSNGRTLSHAFICAATDKNCISFVRAGRNQHSAIFVRPHRQRPIRPQNRRALRCANHINPFCWSAFTVRFRVCRVQFAVHKIFRRKYIRDNLFGICVRRSCSFPTGIFFSVARPPRALPLSLSPFRSALVSFGLARWHLFWA